jgi:hypothetical protein
MRRILLLLCVLLVVHTSCHSGFKPLPPRDLERLLGDINIAETYCAQIRDTLHRESGKNIDSLGYYYRIIMKHYDLTEQTLAANIEWCKAHPEELDSVYAKIIVRTVTYQNHLPK